MVRWQGDVSGISIFWFQRTCRHHVVAILHLGGGLSFRKTTQRYGSDVSYIPWGGTRSPAAVLWLNCCLSYYYFSCWTAFPLFLHFLTSLIIDYLTMLFGTRGRPRRLKFFYRQEVQDSEVSYLWRPCRALLGFRCSNYCELLSHLYLIMTCGQVTVNGVIM